MKLLLFYYECKKCNSTFKSPGLIGDAYGEFLMRSKSGKIVYLNSFKDPIFEEFESLFKEVKSKNIEINKANEVNIFQNVFSIACDIACDGTLYSIRNKPVCVNCGDANIGSWGPTDPAEYIDKDIKSVTHEHWVKLKIEEKKILLRKRLMIILRSSRI